MNDFFDVAIDNMDQQALEHFTSETTTIKALLSTGGSYVAKANIVTDETALEASLITKNEKICQGQPIIRNTRISVANIVELYYLLEWDMEKIYNEYPHLSKEEIAAALEYYENHISEIDSFLKEEKESDKV